MKARVLAVRFWCHSVAVDGFVNQANPPAFKPVNPGFIAVQNQQFIGFENDRQYCANGPEICDKIDKIAKSPQWILAYFKSRDFAVKGLHCMAIASVVVYVYSAL